MSPPTIDLLEERQLQARTTRLFFVRLFGFVEGRDFGRSLDRDRRHHYRRRRSNDFMRAFNRGLAAEFPVPSIYNVRRRVPMAVPLWAQHVAVNDDRRM